MVLRDQDTPFGLMFQVQTPTGITGLMRKLDVEHLDSSTPLLAFTKRDFTRKGIFIAAGGVHPLSVNELPTETTYDLSIGSTRYNIRDKAYVVHSTDIELSVDEMSRTINIADYNRLRTTTFPLWKQINDGRNPAVQTWGCGKSSTVINFLKASAGAEVSAEASVWSWFKAKLSGSIETGSDQTWTITQADQENQHRMTFWNLMDPDNKTLLQIVIDRTRKCDAAESGKWDYVFSFPNQETEEITLTHKWAKENDFPDSPAVPLILSNLQDLHKLAKAMNRSGFLKFEGSESYDSQVRDLIIKISAAVVRPI